ncbi:MAG: hypothetical protein ACRDPC_17925 [Solirubrobacteraceae bacterium]
MVVTDSVDVIEDQRHLPSPPRRALSAQLAQRALETGLEETLLQMTARERGAFDEDLVEWLRRGSAARQRFSTRSVRVEVVDRNPPDIGCIGLERPPVPTAGTHAEAS